MSAATWRPRVRAALNAAPIGRPLAVLSAAVLVGSFTSVMYGVSNVVGDPQVLVGLVAGTLVVATGCSRLVRVRTAVVVTLLALLGGLWVYVTALPVDVLATTDQVLSDVVSLLTGLSVLRLQEISLWTLVIAPPPVFLTWYLALRRRYVAAATAGGAALLFFVLTGDVTTPVALAGTLGALGTVGFGRVERFGGAGASVETLVLVLVAIVLVTATVSVVPGGGLGALEVFGDSSGQTLEGSLVSTDDRVAIQGAIELSPAERFTVDSGRRDYWRAASYRRYTGSGWVRTGSITDDRSRLDAPPGRTTTVRQEYTVESRVGVMPAAWRPVSVAGEDGDAALVATDGSLQPTSTLDPGDTYTVTSQRPVAPPADLASAGTDYPGDLQEQYTQLPESTPDRVRERTDRITANADNPYETALVVEQWLENNREYSLEVERPSGDVADQFLFEMERGYCTYYATTMVAMLRAQDIPARFVVGYTPGERDGNRYTVRGLDSHAWVEVYFPETGWVRFDPTPAGPRQRTERDRLSSVDGANRTTTAATTGSVTTTAATTGSVTTTAATTAPEPTTVAGDGGGGVPLPSREQAAFGLVALAGVAVTLRRTGAGAQLYRGLWLRYQPRTDPAADVTRAFERVEYLLGESERPRRTGETPRQYLAAVDADDRAWAVYEAYERARYVGDVTATEAEAAVTTANALVADRRLLSL